MNATTIEITMNTAITDSGNGWFYGVDGVPVKVKTTSGGEVVPSGGDVEFT